MEKKQKEEFDIADNAIEQEDKGIGMKKPFNPNNIKVQLEPTSVYSMVERIKHNEVKLDTEFQRKEGLWKDEQQSRLIESILIRFPLPVFYFDVSNPNEWLVIDGLQRLSSLKRFMITKELKLSGLEFLTNLKGMGWDDLDRHLQRQINETSLQCYKVEGDDDVKFNIFKRINTGGLNLSSQEIRHAMHQKVASFLKRLAESKEFAVATREKISSERMLDRDFINRFLAFYVFNYDKDYEDEDLDLFMNKALNILSKMDQEELNEIERRFKAAMVLSYKIFGDTTFAKSPDQKRINKALFEVMSSNFAKLSDAERAIILAQKTNFRNKFFDEIRQNDKLADSFSSNTGGKANVVLRHSTFNKIIKQLISPQG